MGKVEQCEVCFVPDYLPEVAHAPWCPGVKQLKRETEEIRKQYSDLKAAHDQLRKDHDALCRSAGPAISANVRY